jgi:hypothetical protein
VAIIQATSAEAITRPWGELKSSDKDFIEMKHLGHDIRVPRSPIIDIKCPMEGCTVKVPNTKKAMADHLNAKMDNAKKEETEKEDDGHHHVFHPPGQKGRAQTKIQCPICLQQPVKTNPQGKVTNRDYFTSGKLAEHWMHHYVRLACPGCPKTFGAEPSSLFRHWDSNSCETSGGHHFEHGLQPEVQLSVECWTDRREKFMAELE